MNKHALNQSSKNAAANANRASVPLIERDAVLRAVGKAIARIEQAMSYLESTSPTAQEGTDARPAFERFIQQLQGIFKEAGPYIKVTHNVSWVKIQSLKNGHRVYVSKGKFEVGRVDSTLPPEVITGATPPGIKNGRIASWLPTNIETVKEAVRLLTAGCERVRPLD